MTKRLILTALVLTALATCLFAANTANPAVNQTNGVTMIAQQAPQVVSNGQQTAGFAGVTGMKNVLGTIDKEVNACANTWTATTAWATAFNINGATLKTCNASTNNNGAPNIPNGAALNTNYANENNTGQENTVNTATANILDNGNNTAWTAALANTPTANHQNNNQATTKKVNPATATNHPATWAMITNSAGALTMANT